MVRTHNADKTKALYSNTKLNKVYLVYLMNNSARMDDETRRDET